MGKHPIHYHRGNALTLTVRQAAERLGISEYMAQKLVKDGKLRTVRFGRLVQVPLAAIEELLGEKPN